MTGSVSVMRPSLAQQAEDLRRLPGWLRQRQFQLGGRARAAAALVLQAERDLAHRQLARGQPAAQLFGQPSGHGQHRVGVLQVFHQLDAAGEARRRLDPALRLGRQTIGGVQRRQQFGRAAPLQAGARQGRAGRPAWRSRCPAASPARPRRGSRASGSASSLRTSVGRVSTRRQAPFAALRQQPARRRRWAPCDTRKSSARTWRRPGAPVRAGHGRIAGWRPRPAARWPRRPARPRACIAAGQRRAPSASASACGLRGSSSTWGAMAAARRMSSRTPARRAAGVRAITRSCSSTAYAWASSGQCGRMASSGRQRRQAAIQRRMAGGCFEGAGLQAHVQRRIAGRPRRLRIWTDSPPGAGASASRKGAGVAWAAAADGRRATNSRSLAWAARCSRRSDSGRTWGSQQSRRRSCRS